MKIAFISVGNPENKRIWSGTTNKIYTSLLKLYEVEVIDLKERQPFSLLSKAMTYLIRKFAQKNYSRFHSLMMAKHFSKQVSKKLREMDNVDLIFLAGNSHCITYLDTKIPIVYLTDATFSAMQNYYPSFTNLLNKNINEGNLIEKTALDKSSLVILASDWAKNSVINDYGIAESKAHVIPFGANINRIPSQDELFQQKRRDTLNLIFIGVSWDRKGGDIAVNTVKELRRRNIDCSLKIVGAYPPYEINDPEIEVVGFLNKNIEEDNKRLDNLILNSDILILPTRAECAGIAFAEACAYGLPIVTYDTGGIGNYVINNYNGFRLNINSSHIEFANTINQIYYDKKHLDKLKKNSRMMYEETLNWTTWLNKVEYYIDRFNVR